MNQPHFQTLAAVDLGSNSFRLQIARIVDDQSYTLDSLQDTVRLGGGLTEDNYLDETTQERALACLARFGERLRGFNPDAVRVVGTNTLRVSKNATAFIAQAEALLGFPIEIIAGREEARLIYLGAAHSLPSSREKRLVVDIGGGSTEFIIGSGHKALRTESLTMGCVSYSRRFFPDGKIGKAQFREAEAAAGNKVQTLVHEFAQAHWDQAIGTSGTARSLRDILEANEISDGEITLAGMEWLKEQLIDAGHIKNVSIEGLRAERVPVISGGLAVMLAVFQGLGIEQMQVTDGALREGVLYDMLGRHHHRDMRETTVTQFKRRYHVDLPQSQRVATLACRFAMMLNDGTVSDLERMKRIEWAAKLHEIGLSIAHSSYHKHSAYIVEQADMPGFSRREQKHLAFLVVSHKGSLSKLLNWDIGEIDWPAVCALRLAVIFSRSRSDLTLPDHIGLTFDGKRFSLSLPEDWLEQNPLTTSALRQETQYWKGVGMALAINA